MAKQCSSPQEERCRGVSAAASGAAQSSTYKNKCRGSWGSKHLLKTTPPLHIILIFSHEVPIFVVTSMEDSEVWVLQKSQGQGQLNYISKLLSHNAPSGLRPHLDKAPGVGATPTVCHAGGGFPEEQNSCFRLTPRVTDLILELRGCYSKTP